MGTISLAINRLRVIKMAIWCARIDDIVKRRQLAAQKAHAHMVSRLNEKYCQQHDNRANGKRRMKQ